MRRIVSTGNLALSQSLEKELMSFYFCFLLYSFQNIHIKVTPFIARIICYIVRIFAIGKEIPPYVPCLLEKEREYFLIILFASVEGRTEFCSTIKELEQPFVPTKQTR
jgi:hypothetical protein